MKTTKELIDYITLRYLTNVETNITIIETTYFKTVFLSIIEDNLKTLDFIDAYNFIAQTYIDLILLEDKIKYSLKLIETGYNIDKSYLDNVNSVKSVLCDFDIILKATKRKLMENV